MPRRPSPAYQMFSLEVVHEVVQRTASVSLGILDLSADLSSRLALPPHFDRREMPARGPGHAARVEIGVLMTDWTTHRREAKTVLTAGDRGLMQPGQITLVRAVADGVTIDATRIGQHFADFGKQCRGPRCGVGDCGKAFRGREGFRRGV